MSNGPRNLVQKIAARHLIGGGDVTPGSFVRIKPRRVMSHDNSAAIINKFTGLFTTGFAPTIADPTQPVICLDHDIQNLTPDNLGKYARIEKFTSTHDLVFHRAGEGIGHQLMLDRGHVIPGAFCVASDSHANAYGALGAIGSPVVRTDAAALWATGDFWWRVPRTVRIELVGTLQPGVVGKDVIVTLCDRFRRDALNAAVEFGGPGLATLSIADRIAIANMTTEWGATACVMQADGAVVQHLRDRADRADAPMPTLAELEALCEAPDRNAEYAVVIKLDLSTVTPSVTGPNSVNNAAPAAVLAERSIRIDKAYLLSCVNGRLDDFRDAAALVRGRRIAEHVQLYIAAASREVQRQSIEAGYWQTLLDAGAIELPPGCGPCIGLGQGTVEAGEVAISATNRNYPGRMGSREAEVYLASPAVVIASAIAGCIATPERGPAAIELHATIEHYHRRPSGSTADARPSQQAATHRALLIAESDVSTDQVFAGKWTYREGLTADDMARVAFENLDASLAARIEPGDIVLAGANFGTGSSREQAATALIAAGVRAVVCVSASETYQRNAINNGLLCLECPELETVLPTLANEYPDRIGPELSLDLDAGVITIAGRTLSITPPAPFIADLLAAGGLEAATRKRLAAMQQPAGAAS